MGQKERRSFEGDAFELADETKTGGAKIVFRLIARRLTLNWTDATNGFVVRLVGVE